MKREALAGMFILVATHTFVAIAKPGPGRVHVSVCPSRVCSAEF